LKGRVQETRPFLFIEVRSGRRNQWQDEWLKYAILGQYYEGEGEVPDSRAEKGGSTLKKALVLILALALAVAVIAIAGCGGDETIETPIGDVTVEEDNGSVTIETEEGELTAEGGEGEPSEADLGVPIYPDAEYVEGSGYSGTISDETGSFSSAGGEWTTSDSYDDVVAFYTDELGAPLSDIDGTTWILGDAAGDDVATVVVEESGGEVLITIGRLVTE
jgi:hypothetical protein